MSNASGDIYELIQQIRNEQRPAALVTVIRTKGSVPRDTGSKMIVQADGTFYGTIGGSKVEALVIEEAIIVIKSGKAAVISHNLNDEEAADTGMVCGGTMEFFIEPLQLNERLFIFGAGHVAYYLARFASDLGFSTIVVDDRADFASADRYPMANEVHALDPGEYAQKLELMTSDSVVIVTRGHKDDYKVLRGVINKPCKYLGMIGSKVKRKQIYQKLKDNDGIENSLLEKVHCPIGLDISAQTPQEIAIAIVAEMIRVRHQNS